MAKTTIKAQDFATLYEGFTAPVSGTTAGNQAPYTVTQAGVEYDNSNSRLNVAKAGIASILQTFLPVADFGSSCLEAQLPSTLGTRKR